jgi:hypothetical protein
MNLLENKYSKIYFNLINTRKNLTRSRGDGNYYEEHHMIPKSFGGSNDGENLVLLLAREHFLAHWLLTKCTEGEEYRKMVYAFLSMYMVGKNNIERTDTKHKKSGRVYQRLREIYSEVGHSEETIEKIRQGNLGKKRSQEFKEKMRQVNLGRKPSPEAIEKARQANLGRKPSPEAIEKTRQANLGRKRSEEFKEKLRQANLGRKCSEETKEKLRQTLKNKKNQEVI